MRTYRIVILVLAVSLFLAGCGTPKASKENAPASAASKTQGAITKQNNKYDRFYEMGEFASVEDGLYTVAQVFPSSASIVYTDYATQKQLFLCDRPECVHDNDTCQSYIALGGMFPPTPFVIGEKLFLLLGETEQAKAHIQVSDLDGTGRKTLVEFAPSTAFLSTMITDGHYLFFNQAEVSKDGLGTRNLMQVDLQTGETTKLCPLNTAKGYYQLVGTTSNKLCLVELEEEKAENNAKLVLMDPYDFDNKDVLTTYTFSYDYAFVCSDYLYTFFQDTGIITQTNLKTAEKKQVQLEYPENLIDTGIYMAFDNQIYYDVDARDSKTEELVSNRYIVDFDSGELTLIDLKTSYRDSWITVAGVYKDSLCVINDFEEREFTAENEDGDMEEFSSYVDLYAMISKDDYMNSIPNYAPIQNID